jgi:hypothetical protein
MMVNVAAVRLFAAALEIENEIEDELADAISNEELLAWFQLDPDERQKAVRAALEKHPEYQHVKAELGRLLELRPTDINPLDVLQSSEDDSDVAGWVEATEKYRALCDGFQEWLCWWRPKASSGNVVHLRSKPEAAK